MDNETQGMTDEQFKIFLKLVIQIIKDNDKESAIQKLEALIQND